MIDKVFGNNSFKKAYKTNIILSKKADLDLFKSFSDATATATTNAIATASAANKTWIFKSFSRNA